MAWPNELKKTVCAICAPRPATKLWGLATASNNDGINAVHACNDGHRATSRVVSWHASREAANRARQAFKRGRQARAYVMHAERPTILTRPDAVTVCGQHLDRIVEVYEGCSTGETLIDTCHLSDYLIDQNEGSPEDAAATIDAIADALWANKSEIIIEGYVGCYHRLELS